VGVHAGAEVEDHPFTRPRRRPALHHPDHTAEQGHRHHADAEQHHPAQVTGGNGGVEQVPHEERGRERDQRDHHDRPDHHGKQAAVGLGVPEDAAQQRPVDCRPILLLVVLDVGPPIALVEHGASR